MINLETLKEIKDRFEEINGLMAQPDVATNPRRIRDLGRERNTLEGVVRAIERYERMLRERDDLEEMLREESGGELADMARTELEELEERLPGVESDLRMKLVPRDPEDAKDAIVEIRAGTGGDEASLFVGDLFRMYEKYAEGRGWRVEVMEASPGTQGGFKEIILSIQGQEAFGLMKFESGVHRVQRVPATESSGRLHTSAATVAVLPEAEEVDVKINQHELKIDVYRSSGPGGQSVNTTDSAVRITHIPTGLVVTCQDEKSQHKNKDKAMRVLRSRLYEQEMEKRHTERSMARRSMVGSGDRSAKIRTYNYPQDRVTDHRLEGDAKNHPLHQVVEGDLDEIIGALRTAENMEKLAGFGEGSGGGA
jgi:peptide chain release factor 1